MQLNGLSEQYVRACVRLSVRLLRKIRLRKRMYCEQTAGSRRVNCCIRIIVDEISSPADFFSESAISLTLNFNVEDTNREYLEFRRCLPRKWRQIEQTRLLSMNSVAFAWHIFIWNWAISKSQLHAYFKWEYLTNGKDSPTLLLALNIEVVCELYRLAYLDLTLVHSKGQGQDHAYFDCKYL